MYSVPSDRGIQGALDPQSAQFARHDRLQAVLEADRDQVAGAVLHGFLNALLVRLFLQGDDRNFGVISVFQS